MGRVLKIEKPGYKVMEGKLSSVAICNEEHYLRFPEFAWQHDRPAMAGPSYFLEDWGSSSIPSSVDDEELANGEVKVIEMELAYYDGGEETTLLLRRPRSIQTPKTVLDTVFVEQEKPETKKIAFVLRQYKDIEKLMDLSTEFRKKLIFDSKNIPKSVLEHTLRLDVCDKRTPFFWPSNWVTYVFFNGRNFPDYKPYKEASPIPIQLWCLPNIERLCLEQMYTSHLPHLVGCLRNLKVLSLHYNIFRELPQTLRFCRKIEYLNLTENRMRDLPMWITKLKKLKTLRRLQNPLRIQTDTNPQLSCEGETEEEQQEVVPKNDDREKKLISPNSLFFLASTMVIRTHPSLASPDIMSKELPLTVLRHLSFFSKDVKFCDYCNQAFLEKKYTTISKVLRELNGNSRVPVKAIVCGDICADKLFEELAALTRKEQEQDEADDCETCFDVQEPEQDNIEEEASTATANNRQSFLRRLCFSCCVT